MKALGVVKTRAFAIAGILIATFISSSARSDDIRALIIGGGPTPESNQVAIESNVRYVLKLLPKGSKRTVLFADGDRRSKTVVFEEQTKQAAMNEHLLDLILKGHAGAYTTIEKYRAPNLAQLDGAAKKADIAGAFNRLKNDTNSGSGPLLLYFTGHGSQAENQDLTNNVFDLWGEKLSVRELAGHVAKIPSERPIALVMVQCFSGAFGNLLFDGGNPANDLSDREIAGFFSTIDSRMAAGCTPEVDEKEYRDFTSYFFAAMSGEDRVGRKVTGADYDGDGVVSMDEAFCYALAHDVSIDIPVCTSDVFLRKFAKISDETVFKTPYGSVKEWASPAQRTVLEELSTGLGLTTEDRGKIAYARAAGGDSDTSRPRRNALFGSRRVFNRELESARKTLFARWPDLKDSKSSAYPAARSEALESIRRSESFKFAELLKAEDELMSAYQASYEKQLAEARIIRFVRLFKSVVLSHEIREGTDPTLQRRLAKLQEAEHRTLLPTQQVARVIDLGPESK